LSTKTQDLPKAKLSPRRRGYLIWFVPFFAAAAAAWLVYESVQKSGPVIIIDFSDGSGLLANQTVLRYRGVRVGEVRSVGLTKDAQHVEVTARLDQSAVGLAREGALFWVVRPEVSAGGLSGLETIVSGSYIQIQPGKGAPQKKFKGVEEGPSTESVEDGLQLTLTAPDAGSIASGSPIYYRGIEVGSVQQLTLSDDANSILIHAAIHPNFASLVHSNTRFWNAGGINVDLKLFGIKLRAESFKSLLAGGIAFNTPEPVGGPATTNAVYTLYDKPQ
jgi:paraquat-inducible protein B